MVEKDPLTSNKEPLPRRHDSDGNPIVGAVEWRQRILHSNRLTRPAKYVGFLLSMFMDTDDGHTWVGQATLAHYGGYTTRKPVAKGLRELRRNGYLRSRRISRRPEPGFRYVHYAALPGDRSRDTLPKPPDPHLEPAF